MPATSNNQRGYLDLHEHIDALEKAGLLVRVKRQINKDTELHPLVRWQYRGGLAEEQWRGFLFENVSDAKGRHYDMPVGVGVMAGSMYIYALGLGCSVEEVSAKWEHAYHHTIDPVLVDRGPVQEIIQLGADLERAGGLKQFPVPISTPGFDGAPFLTAANCVTKDPVTGIRNMGNYRGHLKAANRVGIYTGFGQHSFAHWKLHRERQMPMAAAISRLMRSRSRCCSSACCCWWKSLRYAASSSTPAWLSTASRRRRARDCAPYR